MHKARSLFLQAAGLFIGRVPIWQSCQLSICSHNLPFSSRSSHPYLLVFTPYAACESIQIIQHLQFNSWFSFSSTFYKFESNTVCLNNLNVDTCRHAKHGKRKPSRLKLIFWTSVHCQRKPRHFYKTGRHGESSWLTAVQLADDDDDDDESASEPVLINTWIFNHLFS